jgi:anti-sigma B factor antagonist
MRPSWKATAMLPPPRLAEEVLRLTVTADATSVWVEAEGEVDTNSAPQLVAALEKAVAGGAGEVTAVLDDVTFLDSAGLHALATAYRSASAVGATFQVTAARRAVRKPLELSGLWRLVGTERGLPGVRTVA